MRAFKIKEEAYIREHYGSTPLIKIAEHLGRRKSVVVAHIKLMGLKLTPEQREVIQNRVWFKKGNTPHNKNSKGLMKPNRTTFKSGHQPHNSKHDGAISIRSKQGEKPYKYLRIAKAKWVLLHRHTWEQANGPIPRGYLLRFIDGDSMNCELDNLELITRADNVLRNINREKAAESIKMRWKIKRAKAKLKEEFPNIFD